MSKPVITINKVSKFYGKGAGRQQVLTDVTVDVKPGELVSIVGTSGSGKSTLLNVVGGLDREYTGEVTVLNQKYTGLSDNNLSRLRNNRIGFVFQSFNLLDHLTCWENVALPAFFGKHPGDAKQMAHEHLERVGLEDKYNAKPGNLSGGQKQRVAIARALFNKPDLLLCDEPTGNLDTRTGQQIIDLFSSLNKNMGITVIIVTHEVRVSEVADRCIRLEDGKVTSNDASSQASAREPDDEPKAKSDTKSDTKSDAKPNAKPDAKKDAESDADPADESATEAACEPITGRRTDH